LRLICQKASRIIKIKRPSEDGQNKTEFDSSSRIDTQLQVEYYPIVDLTTCDKEMSIKRIDSSFPRRGKIASAI